jgi:DNA recombination protein RmuC
MLMEVPLIILAFAVVLLGILLFRRKERSDSDRQTTLAAQQADALRGELRESLQSLTITLERQLQFVTTQLQSQTQSVGNRLDNAAKVIGDVQRNLGELGRATEEIRELGLSVSRLDNLLRAPKLRGGLGEYLLEELLRQVLPSDHYVMQYRFRNGTAVDAVIRTSDSLTPIDSKFPLENFRKMIEAPGDQERRGFRRTLLNDVRKHIDSIAEKYIRTDEGTFPFALMYIPSEAVYYEVVLASDPADAESVYEFALRKNVIPVSPNSLYAYLLVISLGLRGLKIEERAREIQQTLGGLNGDIAQLRTAFDTLGTHLENAHRKYSDVDKHFVRLEGKVGQIAEAALQPERTEVGKGALLS